MNKKLRKFVGGMLVAFMLVAGAGAYAVYAQAGTPAAPTGQQQGPGPGGPRGPHKLGGAALDAAAQALGMTSDELSTELQSGKTLSDIATEKDVDLQTVKDAIQTAHDAELRTRINQAVTDGKLSQDKANWLLEGLDKGYLDGPGPFSFGPGGPRGGPRNGGPRNGGPGNGGQGGAAPTQ